PLNSVDIGVVSDPFAVAKCDCIHSANLTSLRRDLTKKRDDRGLVRNRYREAGNTEFASVLDEVLHIRSGELQVDEIEILQLECTIVNIGRQRMPHRISNDADQLRCSIRAAESIDVFHISHCQ